MESAADVKGEEKKKGGLTLTPTERTSVAENHQATQLAPILGLNEEEVAFGIQYACGPHMGNQSRSYAEAFPAAGTNYASTRSSELMKRKRVLNYIRLISTALMERLIVRAGGPERLANWEEDAREAKAILKAARRRAIRLTSVESSNLIYVINRALGSPVQVGDVTYRDEAATIQALNAFARRVQEERRQVREVSA